MGAAIGHVTADGIDTLFSVSILVSAPLVSKISILRIGIAHHYYLSHQLNCVATTLSALLTHGFIFLFLGFLSYFSFLMCVSKLVYVYLFVRHLSPCRPTSSLAAVSTMGSYSYTHICLFSKPSQ